MAEEASRRQKGQEESADKGSTTSGRATLWSRFLTRKWIAIIVGLSIIIHGIGFTCYQLVGKRRPAFVSPEVNLGLFQFHADQNEGGRVVSAEFSLSIALLENVEQAARRRLKAHKFRVQQDIEELLRQAHSGDFDDPSLGELKRQLQEQVNETLSMRAIAEVIITDLTLECGSGDQPMTSTAETLPWVDKPAS